MTNSTWTVNRKIPLALFVIIVLNAGALIWGAATLVARVDTIEKWMVLREPVAERVSILEVQVAHVADGIDRIEGKLDALLVRLEKTIGEPRGGPY